MWKQHVRASDISRIVGLKRIQRKIKIALLQRASNQIKFRQRQQQLNSSYPMPFELKIDIAKLQSDNAVDTKRFTISERSEMDKKATHSLWMKRDGRAQKWSVLKAIAIDKNHFEHMKKRLSSHSYSIPFFPSNPLQSYNNTIESDT